MDLLQIERITFLSPSRFSYQKFKLIQDLILAKTLERYYVYNIFTTNHRWLVVIGSNLKLTLRLLFCLNNNN